MSTFSRSGGAFGAAAASVGLGPFLLLVAAVAAAALFRDGLSALASAWSTPEYSHGPIIPVLSAYLMLHQLKGMPANADPHPDRRPGLALIALSILVALVGIAAGLDDVVAYGLIVWIGGTLLVSFGWAEGRRLWPGVLHLVFMLPLPGLIYYKVTTALQLFSSELGVELIRAFGVPVLLDGNIIDLGDYKLAVAEACSGLRYLFPIMSFSYVFATLYRGPVWHKAVLLLSAAPLAVAMNSLRIGIVGVMVDVYGIGHAEGLSHFLEGWVIFISCILVLFLLAWAMLRLQRSPMGIGDALDLDLSGLGPQLARLRLVRPSAALAAVALGTGLVAATLAAAPDRRADVPRREPLALFPLDLGEWSVGDPRRLPEGVRRALGADEHLWVPLSAPGAGAKVDLFLAWYLDQSDGGIHSPEVCIPGDGWEIERIETLDLGTTAGVAEPFPANRAVIRKNTSRQLVYFWFEQAGARTASDYAAKAQLLWNAVRHGRSDGALVRLITPIEPRSGGIEAAEARLASAVKEVTAVLPRFAPGRR